jgi:hypothetical protein
MPTAAAATTVAATRVAVFMKVSFWLNGSVGAECGIDSKGFPPFTLSALTVTLIPCGQPARSFERIRRNRLFWLLVLAIAPGLWVFDTYPKLNIRLAIKSVFET